MRFGLYKGVTRTIRSAWMLEFQRNQEGHSRPLNCPKCAHEMSEISLVPKVPVLRLMAIFTELHDVRKNVV